MNPRVHRSRVTHDRWLVSYADFITLLFAFFVVLYAFAKADQKMQAEIPTAIDRAFRSLGALPDRSPKPGTLASDSPFADQPMPLLNIVTSEDVMSPAKVKDDLESIRRELEKSLSNQVAQHAVSIQMGRDGLIISLREAGFFNSGSATPRPETLNTLQQVAASVVRTPYDVRVEGHTDNLPMHNVAFDSNWELSSARATAIARIILSLDAIPPERLSVAGFAEFHPIASNATPEGRAENRRVDLIILPRTKLNFAAAPVSAPDGPWARIIDAPPSAQKRGP
ncbi:MAG: OmpA family protein [Terracidiphilus sp.]